MSMAKLDAHRCLVRDTVVPLPAPDDVIADYIQPSHVVVPRCTGEYQRRKPYENVRCRNGSKGKLL